MRVPQQVFANWFIYKKIVKLFFGNVLVADFVSLFCFEALDHDVYISLQFAFAQAITTRQRLTPRRGNLILSYFHFKIDKQDFRLEYHWQFEICRTWELQFIIFSSIGIYFPFQMQTFFVVSLGSKMFELSFREICYDRN